jgi:Uncharacterized conserved protein
MTMTLLLALLLLATALAMLGYRRSSHALFGAILLLFLAIGCGPLPQLLMTRLQAPYATRPALDWAPSNAIVLLTAGATFAPGGPVEPGFSAFGRITEAVVLYRRCKQAGVRCTLLLSGGDGSGLGVPLATTYAPILRELGVDPSDLVLETRSRDTWQNAVFARPLLQRIGARRVWLVTSAFHMRRAMLYFARAGVAATAVRADYLKALPMRLPATSNFALFDTALHEYAGIAAYRLYEVTGWNSQAIPSWISGPRPLPARTTKPADSAAPEEARPAAG